MTSFPLPISVQVNQVGGTAAGSGIEVTARNETSNNTTSALTDSNGQVMLDAANISGGYQTTDTITVFVIYSTYEASSSFLASAGNQSLTLTLASTAANQDIDYCTVQDVWDELDGKSSTDISAARVIKAVKVAEAIIDARTGTSFKSNTITNEFYDWNQYTAAQSPENKIGYRRLGLARADKGLTGFSLNEIRLKHYPIVSVTSLSINEGTEIGTDSFTSLTEQSGSGGNYVVDKATGYITFIDKIPAFARKRAFKVTYVWGLDRTSTDAEDLRKMEIVRELAVLLASSKILKSKGSGGQFSGTKSIRVETIQIENSIGNTVRYMEYLDMRVKDLFDELGVFECDSI